MWDNFLGLKGPTVRVNGEAPSKCLLCGASELYQQHDFRRNLGLAFVVFCALVTIVLEIQKFSFFVVWSPFLLALVFDRGMAFLRPQVAICYSCGGIHRGLAAEQVARFPPFDLEDFDRIQFKLTHSSE